MALNGSNASNSICIRSNGMTCYHSKPAWKAGIPNENGKHAIRFNFRDQEADYYIGCGKCEGCRAKQSRDWAIRMVHESKFHNWNSFVTLTYNDDNMPTDGKISKHDIQKFIKRLRKQLDTPVRYYVCGEYGDQTKRPHYHACFFGQDFRGPDNYNLRDGVYANPYLDRIWGMGHVEVAEFNLATAMYTAGYVSKKVNDPDTFSLQSRYPPLGKQWLDKYHDQVRQIKSIIINGQQLPVPQVYKIWLEKDHPETYQQLKEFNQTKVKPLNDQKLRSKKINHLSRKKLKEKTI